MEKTKKFQYSQPHSYLATITDVLDGNTITANIDLGFDITLKNRSLLLFGVIAPKIDTEAGIVSKEALKEKICGKEVTIEVIKEVNGCYYGLIWLSYTIIDESSGEVGFICINDWLSNNNYVL